MKAGKSISRRSFLTMTGKGVVGGWLGASLLGNKQAMGYVSANEKVNVALIGTGNMGSRHLEALAVNENCSLVALCDVGMARIAGAQEIYKNITGDTLPHYQDFRDVLELDEVDAIFVVTPDHWHPLLAIMGAEAGKDVYVEKPTGPTVAEGRAMVRAARKYGRVMQLGTQQRSMPVFQKAIDVVRSGRLGTITTASAWIGINSFGIGETPEPVPRGLDWDMWLGPSPWVPYSPQRYGGHMGWHDYCRGGQLTNWGIHLVDIVHWGIGQDKPLNVQAVGGSYRGSVGAENFEVIECIYEYPGCTVTWEQRHTNIKANKGYGISFQGTQGRLYVDRGSYVVEGVDIPEYVGEPERSWANDDHHNNFFECIRTRNKPAADIEQGHRSSVPIQIAGIALKTQRKLNWDGEKEEFIRDEEANRYLSRPYRAPWRLT